MAATPPQVQGQAQMPVHPILFLFHLGVSRNSWNLRRELQWQKLDHLRSKIPLLHPSGVLSAPIRDMIDPTTGHHMMTIIPHLRVLLATDLKLHLTMRCNDKMALLGMVG